MPGSPRAHFAAEVKHSLADCFHTVPSLSFHLLLIESPSTLHSCCLLQGGLPVLKPPRASMLHA